MPENKSQKGQIEIDRSEDKCMRDKQDELRNEMRCDRGGDLRKGWRGESLSSDQGTG